MNKKQTKIERVGAFWCVYVVVCGKWIKMRDLYPTKTAAESGRTYWACF